MNCSCCGKDIGYVKPSRIAKNPNRVCMSCHKSKTKGISKHGGGYVLVTVVPGRNGKRVLEHRLVMERHLGRKLSNKEVVHHINENKLDNRIENLMLFDSAGQHTSKAHRVPTCPQADEWRKPRPTKTIFTMEP